MADIRKTVLITQVSKRQEEIWFNALNSQISLVVQKSHNVDFAQIINQNKDAEKRFDLLLIDIGIKYLNPYTLCQSCRGQDLNMKIILTTGTQNKVTSAERRWAIYQGAQDLLPGFQPETLLDEGVARVNRVLQVLGGLPLQREPLIPILFPLISSSVPQEAILPTNKNILSSESNPTGASETNKNMPLPESKPEFDNQTQTKKGHSYRNTV